MAKDDTESLNKMAAMVASGEAGSAWDAALEVAKGLTGEQSAESTRKRLHRKFKENEALLLKRAGGSESELWREVFEAMRYVRIEERPKILADMARDYDRRLAALKETYRRLTGLPYLMPGLARLDPEMHKAIVIGILAPEDKLHSKPPNNEGDDGDSED